MLGDATGDMQAAYENHIAFYPINPGNEITSWKRFYDEVFDIFIKGQYTISYEEQLIKDFNACLPEYPLWLNKTVRPNIKK